MSASAASRETGRDALTTLLTTALVGTSLPVQEVRNYLSLDFGGASPVVQVVAAATPVRERFGIGTVKFKTRFRYEVQIFVIDAVMGDTAWTRQSVEDRLDLIEKKIADVVADNRNNPPTWNDLRHSPDTQPLLRVSVGGDDYWLETVLLEMEVTDV